VKRLCAIGLFVLSLAAGAAQAQVIQGTYNPRDDQYRLLGLIRAQAEFERAAAAYERGQKLAADHVLSAEALEELQAAYERARVDYMQQSLTVIFAAPHVTIERAIKRTGAGGASRVELELRNATGSGFEAVKLEELIAPELLDKLRPDEIRDVYVSLKADPGLGGTVVSRPYEAHVPVMRVGEPVRVGFTLLRDLDEIVVAVSYADKLEERRVLLEKDAAADIVAVQSVQFSQEADLGAAAVYDLQLDRFTGEATVFRLVAVGLPRDVASTFRDPGSGARVSQIRFAGGETQKHLQIQVSLPQRSAGTFSVDEPLRFWVLALDEAHAAELETRLAREGIEAARALRAGRTELEVIPRGVGRVEVRAPNLYHEIDPGETVSLQVALRNNGSRRLDSVRVRLEPPLGWEATVAPDFLERIEVDAEAAVQLTLVPPPGVRLGDYEARFRTESAAADQRVETEDKTLRIHVAAASSWIGTASLLAALLGLVAALVVVGVRLTRR
jgi:hypothetical protein